MEKELKEIYALKVYKEEYRNKTHFTNERESVYGEITQKATDSLVSRFNEYFNENTVFYDLGCGLGKMVIHLGMQYKLKKSCGIELSKERIQGANDLKQTYCMDYDNITFINKSFFDCDLSDSTVVYYDNTMYDIEFDEKIMELLPKGCLIIFRRSPQNVEGREIIKIKDESLITTYRKTHIYYMIKE